MAILDNPLPIIKTKEVPVPVDKIKTGALRVSDRAILENNGSIAGLNFCLSGYAWEVNITYRTFSASSSRLQHVIFSALGLDYGETPIGISLSADSTYPCIYVYGKVAGSSGTNYQLFEHRIGESKSIITDFNKFYSINISWDGNTGHGILVKLLDENGQELSRDQLNCTPKSASCNYAFYRSASGSWFTAADTTDIDFYKTYIKVRNNITFGYK